MKKVCVFLADGFEEIEGLTVVDLLRRAQIEVLTVAIGSEKMVHGAHGIDVAADTLFTKGAYDAMDMLVLPGGLPGTIHLQEHAGIEQLIREFAAADKYIAAICAAPSILGALGMLKGRKAVSHPSKEEALTGATVLKDNVAVDGKFITSRGMGTAIDFSLTLIEVLKGADTARQIAESIVYQCS